MISLTFQQKWNDWSFFVQHGWSISVQLAANEIFKKKRKNIYFLSKKNLRITNQTLTSAWPEFPFNEKTQDQINNKFVVCGGRVIFNSFFDKYSQSWDALIFLPTSRHDIETVSLSESDRHFSDWFGNSINFNKKKVNHAECNKLHRILLFMVSESLKVNFILHPTVIREHLFVWIPPR